MRPLRGQACLLCGNRREPLLLPQSAKRVPRVAPFPEDFTYPDEKDNRMTPKCVGVPVIDNYFTDIAEMFNQQQENYKTMTECLRSLKDSYHCSHGDGLSECLMKMRDEHSTLRPNLEMKGYEFSLVLSSDIVPEKLQKAQEWVKTLCLTAKAITATSTKLQEMIKWVLQSEEDFMRQVKKATPNFLDQRRVESNLNEDLKEVKRAKQQSKKYGQEAGDLVNEVVHLTSISCNP
ncbi:uncharacterized protein LOC108933427 isoform X2 [Scleropages formosus]|uniref:uncharacterized protein LOC108933427 isoform X2 n=1 Tax=Scleropages formosus TaxID=113540 RepID=UPI00087800D6|nr:uncharacterized protein LOC108933427 isoform X2 [Scleropages formosus]